MSSPASAGPVDARKEKRYMSSSQIIRARHLRATLILTLGLARASVAQVSAPPSSGPPPTPVPLSGRNQASGTVVATETPVPGPTTGVNTLNPVIEVQGSFRGSTPSTRRRPFSGSLSVREIGRAHV